MSDHDLPADGPGGARALFDRVRGFVRETIPEVEERVYKGGAGAGYHLRGRGALCGLFLREHAVYLVFSRGDQLPDAGGLLRGGSGPIRYVALRPGAGFPEDALFHLLVAALLVGADAHP